MDLLMRFQSFILLASTSPKILNLILKLHVFAFTKPYPCKSFINNTNSFYQTYNTLTAYFPPSHIYNTTLYMIVTKRKFWNNQMVSQVLLEEPSRNSTCEAESGNTIQALQARGYLTEILFHLATIKKIPLWSLSCSSIVLCNTQTIA